MEENLKWLWYAFGLAWVLHIAYLGLLSSRASGLRRQMDDLKALLREREGE